MQAATGTGLGRAQRAIPARTPFSRAHQRHPVAPARTRPRNLYAPALGTLLVVSLLLRIWGIKQGLPYSYNIDEATHFVPRAVGFFSHDLNPHYFLNPPAYSYLLYAVFELWFGSGDAVARAYSTDPTTVFVVARVVAALLGTAAVWLTYSAGTRLFGRAVALLAAAIFGLAFLPIFYSHLALNDVPALAPAALALYGAAGVLRTSRRRDYALAGIGIGLAAATKYTAGVMLVCLLGAFAGHAVAGPRWQAVRRLALALGVALGAFLLANPYAAFDFSAFSSGVSSQASLAAGQDPVKLGSGAVSGTAYYLWSFTWGLGLVPAVAALGGAGLLIARRRLAMAMLLLPGPIAFILFMGDQQRFFGRWLMPIFPLVSLLAAYGAVELIRWLARAKRVPVVLGGAVATVLLLVQSVTSAVHNDAVLSRPDTRNLVRAWMVDHVPAGSNVVVEPLVPDNWATDIGRSLQWTQSGDRWLRYPTWLSDVNAQGIPLPAGQLRYVLVDQYERTLRPALLNEYLAGGYCWVVTGSLQAGRAFVQSKAAPRAVAYYRQLAQRSRLMYHVSPFSPSTRPVPFSFDFSTDYYPPQYRLPGPDMSVYRLRGGGCGA